MNRTWTDEQEQYLVAHYATTSNAELAAVLGKKNADRVMAICDIGQVLVNSAKVEVDMMKHTDADGSGFMRNYNVKQIISDKK